MLAVVCKCGKSYEVEERHAGRSVRCRSCGELLTVRVRPADTHAATPPVKAPDTTCASGNSAAEQDQGARPGQNQYLSRGQYSLLGAVAEGGMGRVSMARDEALKRDVALKELLRGRGGSPDVQRRFVAEAEITGQLEHPGIVPIYALGSDRDGNPFYAMRFVKGRTLKEAIDDYHKSPEPAELKSLLRRFVMVCQTMAYAHDRGVIHRDLKPANIMLGPFGETLVVDWGLAKPVDDGKSDDSTLGAVAQQQLAGRPDLTDADAVVGTPAYMPPEQAQGKIAQLGAAADVYSLGAVLYHLLTGAPPYAGTSSLEILEKVKTSPPAKPSEVCRSVPRALEAICLKAMARRPKARYGNASELAKSVEHWLDDEPVESYREPLSERIYRWSRKHRTGVVSGAIALPVVLLIVSVATVLYQRERDKARVFERIAVDKGREAAEADQRAKEKEAEADRLAQEASESRRQANDAAQKGAEARKAAEEARQRISELETALAAKGGGSDELAKQLEAARSDLAAAEERTASESKRADDAIERASELERQVAALRREADDYREIALKLTRLAELAANKRQAAPVELNQPWDDFTQRDPASFDVTADDNSEAAAIADTSRVRAGRQSLRVSAAGGGVCITYPKSRNANWDLSQYDYLTFAFSLQDSVARQQVKALAVRIGRGSKCIEYRAGPEALSLTPKGWAFVKIPLWGNSNWVKRELNPLNLSRVDWIELHISTSSPQIALWLEDIKFGADPRHVDREFVPDPNRAAAEYVVAMKGYVTAWVSGKTVTIHSTAEIPQEPFTIESIGGPGWDSQDVTDVGLRLFGILTDCREINLFMSRVTDEGLSHLSGMTSLENLSLTHAHAVNGSGLAHLARLPRLTGLGLNSTAINDEGMRHVAGLPHLEFLDICNTNVTDEGLQYLRSHPTLSSVQLWGTPITEAGLRNLRDLPGGLRSLGMETRNAPKGIAVLEGARLRTLQLNAEGTDGRIADAILESLRLFPDLEELFLSAAVVDENVVKRLSRLASLRRLYHGGHQSVVNRPKGAVSDAAFKGLSALAAITTLEFYDIGRISDAHLMELSALKTLRTLSITATKIEPEAVIKLQATLPDCTITVDPEIQQAIDSLRNAK